MAATRLHGKGGWVTIDTEDIIGVTSWTLDVKGAADDATGLDSAGAKMFIAGLVEWSGSISGVWDSDDDALLPPTMGSNTDISLRLSVFAPPPDEADEYFYTGDAVATSFKPEVGIDGVVKWTLDFQGNGDLTFPEPVGA